MRRISTGVQGRPILGNFVAETNRFITRESNQDIVLEPNGNGIISAESHIRIDGSHALIFRDSQNNNTITIESPSISSDYTLTLPTNTGSAGDVLTVDSSGNLSFSGINVNLTNQTADTSTYYPLMTTNTSGDIGEVSVSSSKLSFQPSSGTLSVDSVDIDGGSIDGTTIGANSAAAGTFTSITETSSIAYKEDVESIDNAIDIINRLEGVTYYRKSNSQKREAGLIAEEVDKILPEIVQYKDNKPDGINYTKLTAYLIESVKTLKKELDLLKYNG